MRGHITAEAYLAEGRLVKLADEALRQPLPQPTEDLLRTLLCEAEAHAELTVFYHQTTRPPGIVTYLLKMLISDESINFRESNSSDVDIPGLYPANDEIQRLQLRREQFPETWKIFQEITRVREE